MSEGALHLLILVITANSAPVLLTRIIGQRFNCPVDFGKTFFDGRPIFGKSKTWRGLAAATLLGGALAPLLGHEVITGAAAATLAMAGDLISSFSKRRMGLASSAQAPLIDQIPESLLPALVLKSQFQLSWLDIGLIALLFLVLEVVFSVVLFHLGIRKKPY